MISDASNLEVRDRWIARFVDEIPALGSVVGGRVGFDRMRRLVQDEWIAWRGRRIHLEILEAEDAHATVVFHHGYGAYARLYLPFLGMLRDAGLNVVAPDRPGHGLSQGRRGDCTVRQLADLTAQFTSEIIRARWPGPVVVMGSSAGGMLACCMLPYLAGSVDAAVCHNLYDGRYLALPGHRILNRVVDTLPLVPFRFTWIPRRIRQGISEHPAVREWFQRGADPLATYDQTLRSVLSMTVAYEPPVPFSELLTPILVLAGTNDSMVPIKHTARSFRGLQLQRGKLARIEGAGHMLFHEHPRESFERIVPWLQTILAGRT